VSFLFLFFVYSESMPRNEIAESNNSSTFSFLWNLHTAFHTGCTNLHSHEQCKGSFSPHLFKHLLFIDNLMIVILTGVKWYLIIVFIYISPIKWTILNIFSCVCWASVYLLKKKNFCLDLLPIVSDHRFLLLCLGLIDHKCVSLFLGILFCSSDWYVCFCIGTLLFWLL